MSLLTNSLNGGFSITAQTQTAGTPIVAVCPPKGERFRTRLSFASYVAAGTAHDLVVMKALARTKATAAAAASQAVLNIESSSFIGQTLAANDWIVVRHSNGSYGAYKVSSISSLEVTLDSSLTLPVSENAPVWIMGAPGETPHVTLAVAANTNKDFVFGDSGVDSGYLPHRVSSTDYTRSGFGDPLLLYSANGSNAGKLNAAAGVYLNS